MEKVNLKGSSAKNDGKGRENNYIVQTDDEIMRHEEEVDMHRRMRKVMNIPETDMPRWMKPNNEDRKK